MDINIVIQSLCLNSMIKLKMPTCRSHGKERTIYANINSLGPFVKKKVLRRINAKKAYYFIIHSDCFIFVSVVQSYTRSSYMIHI